MLLHFCTRAYLFSPDKGSCYIFSTRNNCCEFLASYGVILQSDIQLYFKTPVCGAPIFVSKDVYFIKTALDMSFLTRIILRARIIFPPTILASYSVNDAVVTSFTIFHNVDHFAVQKSKCYYLKFSKYCQFNCKQINPNIILQCILECLQLAIKLFEHLR